jgi:hypothetical protein
VISLEKLARTLRSQRPRNVVPTSRLFRVPAACTFRRPSPRASSPPACKHLSAPTALSFLRSKLATIFRWSPSSSALCLSVDAHSFFAIALRLSRLTLTVARSPTASCHRECLIGTVSGSNQPARVFEPSIQFRTNACAPIPRIPRLSPWHPNLSPVALRGI